MSNLHENSIEAFEKTEKVKDKEKILSFFHPELKRYTVSYLQHLTNIPLVTLRARLTDLKRENKIIPVGKNINANGNKEDYYRLALPGETNKMDLTPRQKLDLINSLSALALKDCECNPNTSLTEIFYLSS